MKTYEFTAKTIEKAIENGLQELGKSKFDVDIKILESGGLFKKAKVQITVDDDDILDKKPEKQTVTEQNLAQQDQIVAENTSEKQNAIVDNLVTENVQNDKLEQTKQDSDTKSAEQALSDSAETSEIKQENKKFKPKKYENNKGSKQFLEGLLKVLNIDGSVEIEELDEHSKATITTDHAGLIIGHRGEMLSAIQYVANIVEQKNNRYAKRLIVDTSDYRERHDDSLKDLADSMARRVLKYKTPIKLKPMSAYDRRIVHTYLQNFKGVVTHSEGKEPYRCLVIDIDRNI